MELNVHSTCENLWDKYKVPLALGIIIGPSALLIASFLNKHPDIGGTVVDKMVELSTVVHDAKCSRQLLD